MSTVVTRDLPEPLHARPKERANINHRSMTGEAIHLVETRRDGAQGKRASRHGGEPDAPAARAMHAAAVLRSASDGASDGRKALRAALVGQSDGCHLNGLGVEDESFLEMLERFRAETPVPNMDGLFDEAA